jgi:hypothetical protein
MKEIAYARMVAFFILLFIFVFIITIIELCHHFGSDCEILVYLELDVYFISSLLDILLSIGLMFLLLVIGLFGCLIGNVFKIYSRINSYSGLDYLWILYLFL